MAYSPLTSLAGSFTSTSTGTTSALHGMVSSIGLQAVTGSTNQTGTVAIEGSIDGETYFSITSSTLADAVRINSSTFGLVAYVRANVSALGSTATTLSINIIGR